MGNEERDGSIRSGGGIGSAVCRCGHSGVSGGSVVDGILVHGDEHETAG